MASTTMSDVDVEKMKARSADFLGNLPKFDPNDIGTYNAICHCGTVQYTVTISPPLERQKIVSCNCSICSRNGYLLVYPTREHFELKSGEEALKTYSFGRKRNQHKFCGRCGSSVFFDPQMKSYLQDPNVPDLMGVNVRMFKGVELKTLPVIDVDGWNGWPFIDSDHLI